MLTSLHAGLRQLSPSLEAFIFQHLLHTSHCPLRTSIYHLLIFLALHAGLRHLLLGLEALIYQRLLHASQCPLRTSIHHLLVLLPALTDHILRYHLHFK